METGYPTPGKAFRGVLLGQDLTGGDADIPLYDSEGDGSALTVGDDEHLVITSVHVTASATGQVTLYIDNSGNDSAQDEEVVIAGDVATNANLDHDYADGVMAGRDGAKLRISGGATVDVIVTGYIRKTISKSGAV